MGFVLSVASKPSVMKLDAEGGGVVKTAEATNASEVAEAEAGESVQSGEG